MRGTKLTNYPFIGLLPLVPLDSSRFCCIPRRASRRSLALIQDDRVGNTPLHLAMESAHAEVAVLLIEAGADRGRTDVEDRTPENVDGVGGEEQRRVKQYVIAHCGPP
ncbi:hypothetical protein EV363DRAFT_853744 [Boletus edulis]|nr:hypothetical protein EV363DRAFT_853744 [Boletus edulis]